MRVVLDTNILISALISSAGNHLDELRATLQQPRVADLIKPYNAGCLVNQIKWGIRGKMNAIPE
jgi:hypothetical protein